MPDADYIATIMTASPIQHADIVHSYTVRTDDLNGYGIMHGGRLLTLCDETSYAAARQHAKSACLTRAVHQARFHRGVGSGTLLEIHARVGLVGNSSLWVPVEVCPSGETEVVMDAVFVFAAITKQHQPQRVPPLILHTEQDRQLHHKLEAMRAQLLQTS